MRKAKEKDLTALEDMLNLCPRCRAEVHAKILIGDRLRRVSVPLNVSEQRLERIEPIKMDERTKSIVYKGNCCICNSGCDANVFVKDGSVIKVEGDPSSPVTKGTLCPKG